MMHGQKNIKLESAAFCSPIHKYLLTSILTEHEDEADGIVLTS